MCDDRFGGEAQQLHVFALVTSRHIAVVLFTHAIYTPHAGVAEVITSQFLLELRGFGFGFYLSKRVRN